MGGLDKASDSVEPKDTKSLPSQSALRAIGLRYHYETERHDRLVCSGKSPYSGDAMPMTATEHKDMMEGVKAALSVAYAAGRELRVSPQDVEKSIRDASRFSFEELQQIFEVRTTVNDLASNNSEASAELSNPPKESL